MTALLERLEVTWRVAVVVGPIPKGIDARPHLKAALIRATAKEEAGG